MIFEITLGVVIGGLILMMLPYLIVVIALAVAGVLHLLKEIFNIEDNDITKINKE